MADFTPANAKLWARLGSCGAFGVAALELPAQMDNVVMLTADLCGFSGLSRFAAQFPDKFYNMGIAEQNMLGVAAGLAREGLIPFVTTYASFASMRIADQVRVCMGYMRLPIKLVGLTAGLGTGILGATHMAIEDMAVLRAVPNITLLSPADCTETIKATLAAARHQGPVYLRLTGEMGVPAVYENDYDFIIGKAVRLRQGEDISIIATGSMVHTALESAKLLAEEGMQCSVFNMHTIKPLDLETLKEACSCRLMITVEEHSRIGGLGGAVAEALADWREHPPLLILGIEDAYPHAAGYKYLLEQTGLTPMRLARNIAERYLAA